MKKEARNSAPTFFPDNRFEKMGRRPGGIPRNQALARAQDLVDEIKPQFANSLDQELQELKLALMQVEENSSETLSLDKAYSICSQLGDSGTTMGYGLITFVAKNFCEVLDLVKGGALYDKDVIDCHFNALYLAKTDAYRNLPLDEVSELVTGLRRMSERAKESFKTLDSTQSTSN